MLSLYVVSYNLYLQDESEESESDDEPQKQPANKKIKLVQLKGSKAPVDELCPVAGELQVDGNLCE